MSVAAMIRRPVSARGGRIKCTKGLMRRGVLAIRAAEKPHSLSNKLRGEDQHETTKRDIRIAQPTIHSLWKWHTLQKMKPGKQTRLANVFIGSRIYPCLRFIQHQNRLA